MSRGNRLLECPRCEEPTLTVARTDADENNVGMRRYQCEECRRYWTTLEVFFTDDKGDPDPFNQIALNKRIGDREKYHRRKGSGTPRRPLKATDRIKVYSENGRVLLVYKRNPRSLLRRIWPACKRGHPFDETNTAINKVTGGQICRTCRRINQQRWNTRNRDKRRATVKAYDDSHKEQKRAGDRLRRQKKKELTIA